MSSNLWYIGAILGVVASATGTAGKQLFRFSELQRRKGTAAAIYTAKITLLIALLLNTAAGPLIDMASYAFAPPTLIAPLGALDVVWNTLAAPIFLGETLTPLLVLGCAFIFGGAVVTSVVGSKSDGEFTLDDIAGLLRRWPVLLYLILLAVWLFFNIHFLMPRSAAPKGQPWQSGDPIRGLSLGMTAGSIAGNMFFVKAFVEVVQGSIVHQDAEYWAHWLPYALLVGAIFFSLSNLYFLSKAMREYEALFMGAVFEGSLIFAASVSGCVVFRDLESMETWEICVYWLALSSIILGIYINTEGARRKMVMEQAEVAAAEDATRSPEQCGGGVVSGSIGDGASGLEDGKISHHQFSPEPVYSVKSHPATRPPTPGGGFSGFSHIPSLLALPELPAALEPLSDCETSETDSNCPERPRTHSHDNVFTGDFYGFFPGNAEKVQNPKMEVITESEALGKETPTEIQHLYRRSHSYLLFTAGVQPGEIRLVLLEPTVVRFMAAGIGKAAACRLACTSRLAAGTLTNARDQAIGDFSKFPFGYPGARWSGQPSNGSAEGLALRPGGRGFNRELPCSAPFRRFWPARARSPSPDVEHGGGARRRARLGCLRWLLLGGVGPLETPQSSMEDREKQQPQHPGYLVDNSLLQAPTEGLAIRKTKCMQDVDQSLTNGARWGSTVQGRDEGDGWLNVCGHYLPMSVGGVPVLAPLESGVTNESACMPLALDALDQASDSAEPQWNVVNSFPLCKEWGDTLFRGLAVFLDKSAAPTLRGVVDALNQGHIQCAADFCVAFSKPQKEWYVLYRPGKQEAAMHSFGLGAAETPTLEQLPQVRWSRMDSFVLCKEGCEGVFLGRAKFLDPAAFSSIRAAVDSFNQGTVKCPEDFCVVFSARHCEWHVLHRPGARSRTLECLGLSEQWLEEQMADMRLRSRHSIVSHGVVASTEDQPGVDNEWILPESPDL